MKKLFLSILAVAALASCTKNEAFYTEEDSEIKLAPVASMATKADYKKAIDGTTYPAAEEFGVIAYWADEDAGSVFTDNTTIYLGAQGAVPFTKKGNYWGGETAYYWPKNGSLRFAAFSPFKGVDGNNITATHELDGDTYTIDFVQSNNTANTVDLLVAPTTKSYNAQTATEKVSVVFEHTQSWISINLKATEAAKDRYQVKKLTINDVITEGELTAQMIGGKQSWEYTDNTEKAYEVFSGSYTVTTTATLKETNAKGTLVIPQPTTDLTIEFDQLAEGDVPALLNQSLTIPLVLDAEGTEWEAGKHYIYTIIFDRDEILINPSIVDWEDEYINDVPATDNEVATAEEFEAAVNNVSQIRLVDDIELTKNFYITESLNIDLNGYTLTFKITPEIPFRVQDGATLTIGRGNVVSDDYIVSVNKGGVAVINNGNYTANTTAVNVNGGTAYITGGYFVDESSYDGQYLLNHIDENKGLIEVTGGTFVKFNPAAASGENPAMNFVKKGYNVTCVGDEYTVSAVEGNVTLETATTEAITTLNLSEGAVLDGNGNEITVAAEASDLLLTASTLRLISTNGDATIKNLVIDGNNAKYEDYGIRAIFLTGEGTVNIDNVKVKNVTYTINDDSAEKTVNVSNSELEGWTSYNPNTTANFTNVKFQKGTYNTLRPHGNTVLTNCDFGDDFIVNLDKLVAGKTVKFDKCTYKGVEITADNYTDLVQNAATGAVVF